MPVIEFLPLQLLANHRPNDDANGFAELLSILAALKAAAEAVPLGTFQFLRNHDDANRACIITHREGLVASGIMEDLSRLLDGKARCPGHSVFDDHSILRPPSTETARIDEDEDILLRDVDNVGRFLETSIMIGKVVRWAVINLRLEAVGENGAAMALRSEFTNAVRRGRIAGSEKPVFLAWRIKPVGQSSYEKAVIITETNLGGPVSLFHRVSAEMAGIQVLDVNAGRLVRML